MKAKTLIWCGVLCATASLWMSCELPAAHSMTPADKEPAAAPVEKPSPPPPLPAGASTLDRLPDVAETAVKSVVNIASEKRVQQRAVAQTPFSNDPFFRHFFGGRNLRTPPPRERLERSLGSGVIVNKDGVVLTNNHVVEHADKIKVGLSDGREFEANLLGTDDKTDLAVLQIKDPPKDIVPLRLGNSDTLRLGEAVIAVGNPFGVGQTVTLGIVSAKGRADVGIVDYEDFIQTDAAINPGNSGGALVNLDGELVGVNTAILSRSGGYQGIGFAIPANMARTIMDDLLDDGRVNRGYLGVMIQDLTPELAEALELKDDKGVLISGVPDEGPAARAGLVPGDVVLSVDQSPTEKASELRNKVAAIAPGTTVPLEVWREGQALTLEVKLGELDARTGEDHIEPPTAALGLGLGSLNEAARKKFGIDEAVRTGVVILEVESEGRFDKAGLVAGDVILQIGRRPVRSVEQAEALIKQSQGQKLLMRIARDNRGLFVVIPPS